VHGKASLLYKMPGSEAEKFSNLRLLFGYMYTHPGSKLLFMGGEFGQTNEWNFKSELNWGLLQYPGHQGVQRWVRALNLFYRTEKAAYELAYEQAGFEWLVISDYRQSLLIYARKGKNPEDVLIAACNFTPVPRINYQFLVPESHQWVEVLNSDHPDFGGSGIINAEKISVHISTGIMPKYLINLNIPPLGIAILKRDA
ncbi:MAG: alpha amylase C-terminal domain-containing protein, partial [Saprospiraceae bacterium]|nr:alpha amylase C-terminal domain-containing protein [Saprospiraceae bacterium]